MKTILRQYILGVSMGCLLALGGCKRTFNTQPTTSLVSEDFSGAGANQTLLNGIYRLMRLWDANVHHLFGIPSLMITNDLLGEDMGMTVGHYFRGEYQYAVVGSFLGQRSQYIWSFFYRIVDNTNLILEREDAPPAQKAQALALRAFAYFNLVNYYTAKPYTEAKEDAALPLYLTTTKTPQPRVSVKDIYAQILKDLDEAVALFESEEGKKFSAPRKSVIDLSVVYGLLARTYLFMEKWTEAADAADKALSGGKGGHSFDGSDLMSQTEFQSGFNSVANMECMWGLPTNAAQQSDIVTFFSHMDLFINGYAGAIGILKFMSSELYDKIHSSDVRKTVIAQPLSSDTVIVKNGDLAQMKFRDPAVPFALTQQYNTATTVAARAAFQKSVPNAWLGESIIMRKAEMYLIYAEACGKLNNGKMKNALKALRNKRGVPNGTGNLTIDSVYLERRKELFGEGFRFFDLKRLKLPADRTKGGHPPDIAIRLYISANHPDSMRFHIPQGEVNNNPFINQGD